MKKGICLSLFLSFSFSLCSCDKYVDLYLPGDSDVYVVLGQSNASGCTPFSFLQDKDVESFNKFNKANKKVLISNKADNNINSYFEPIKFGYGTDKESFGPEIGISSIIQKEDKTSYIIKSTFSGTNLNTMWLENGQRGNLYNSSIKTIKEKIDYLKEHNVNPIIRGVFWMQGESDSIAESDYNSYKQNTINLIKYLRHDLTFCIEKHLNFVDATIKETDHTWPRADIINKAKTEVANEIDDCYCVYTNNENNSNLILKTKNMSDEGNDVAHYDSLSMLQLGYAAGRFLIKY